jgi:hypothetical protein
MRAHAAGKERVAVGRGGRDPAAADHAARAADILNDQRLPERLAHLLGDDARDHVARPAGRERHDDVDGAGGVVLRVQGRWSSDQGDQRSGTGRRNSHSRFHGPLPACRLFGRFM